MLKTLRESHGISAVFIASKLGIHRDTIKSLEDGKTELRAIWIPVLAKFYGLTNEELLEKYIDERRQALNDIKRI